MIYKSVRDALGIPEPDKDGVFHISHEAKDGTIRLLCAGHPFVVCKVKDGSAYVQVVDIDTGVIFEHNIPTLAWRR